MDLNRYKLDITYGVLFYYFRADGVPWPSRARDRVPGAPTQARLGQLGSRHSVADGHAVLPVSARIGLSSGRYSASLVASTLLLATTPTLWHEMLLKLTYFGPLHSTAIQIVALT